MCTDGGLDALGSAAVSHLPVGALTSPVRHDGKSLVLTATSWTIHPLSAVSGSVIAEMLGPYTDVVDDIVTTGLGIEKVTIASIRHLREPGDSWRFPPDALAPASALPEVATKRHFVPLSPQQFDPFS